MAKEEVRKELVRRVAKERCSKTCDLSHDCYGFRNKEERCPEWARAYKIIIVE